MLRTCIECREPTILGRQIDNHLIVMDAQPVTDGHAVLKGDPLDQPTVIFGIETPADAEYWAVPFESDRYDRHECKTVTR